MGFSSGLLRSSESRLARVSRLLASFLPALAFLYGGYVRRWAGDDGMINLRVVSQLMDGSGFVFNAGERSEAVTSAGWIFVLWLLGELGFGLDGAAWISSLLLSFVGIALAALASARTSARTFAPGEQPTPSLVLPFGVLVYAALPVAWDYETSALENGLGLAYLGLAYWMMARLVSREGHADAGDPRVGPRAEWAAAVVGLAPLVRPDFALYAGPLALIAISMGSGLRQRLRIAACAAAPGGAYQIFRMGYFAALVPNTAIAKEAFEPRWSQGLRYLDNTFATYHLWAPVAVAALAIVPVAVELLRRRELRRAAVPVSLALMGLLHILYVVRLGGDFMHGRMLLPGIFAITAAAGTIRIRWSDRVDTALAGLTVAATVFLGSWAVYSASELRPEMYVDQILDERRWWSDTSHSPHPTHLSDYQHHQFYEGPMWVKGQFAAGCPAGLASLADDSGDLCKRMIYPDAMDGLLSDHGEHALLPLDPRAAAPHVVGVYGFRPIGISGRAMGLRINLVDSFGLADPLAARGELPERGRPGHEKTFPTVWFVAKYGAHGATRDPRVAVAKRALRCGLLRELFEATHEEMSLRRFFENLYLAFPLHRLRVPADPELAVQRFCRD